MPRLKALIWLCPVLMFEAKGSMFEVLPRLISSVLLSFSETKSVRVVWSSVFIPATTVVWSSAVPVKGLYVHE